MTIETPENSKLDGKPKRLAQVPPTHEPAEPTPEPSTARPRGPVEALRTLWAERNSYARALLRWAESRLKTNPSVVRSGAARKETD
ncbi:MAG: hypothetical protein ABW352_18285 [Polyangiales bacterium]